MERTEILAGLNRARELAADNSYYSVAGAESMLRAFIALYIEQYGQLDIEVSGSLERLAEDFSMGVEGIFTFVEEGDLTFSSLEEYEEYVQFQRAELRVLASA